MRNGPRYGVQICDRCGECPWRNDSFFCQFDPVTLKAFDDITFVDAYPEGALLFAEGELPRGLYIVCYGSAKLTISSGGGKKLITRRVAAGETLGLTNVMSGKPYKTTPQNPPPSPLKIIKREDFFPFFRQDPDVSFNNPRQ